MEVPFYRGRGRTRKAAMGGNRQRLMAFKPLKVGAGRWGERSYEGWIKAGIQGG
jgi:hypothetical protein